MSTFKLVVDQQEGSALYRKVPAKRSAEDFDVSKMSADTKTAFAVVCADPNFRHVFESILSSGVIASILGEEDV